MRDLRVNKRTVCSRRFRARVFKVKVGDGLSPITVLTMQKSTEKIHRRWPVLLPLVCVLLLDDGALFSASASDCAARTWPDGQTITAYVCVGGTP